MKFCALTAMLILVTGIPSNAAFPGRNGRIAYTAEVSGNTDYGSDTEGADIWTMEPDGSDQRPLFALPGYELDPTYSPDGRRLTFSSNRSGNYDLYRVNADGSRIRRLTRLAGDEWYAAWSPDGKRIAFTHSAGRFAFLRTIKPDGSGMRLLTRLRDTSVDIEWSPDGKKIAFTQKHPESGTTEIYVARRDATRPRAITNTPLGYETEFDWSPDGKLIAYSLGEECPGGLPAIVGCRADIMVTDPKGVEHVNLTDTPGVAEWFPSWSPDGKEILFTVADQAYANSDVYKMNVDGSGRTVLTTSPGFDADPNWQPLP